ncbi:MAG: pyruvate dehydrogenase complex dehydrogenase (E1) component, partial [Candidatus Thalassarchaeaceae archaeon]
MSGLKPHQNLPDDDVEETDEWLESLRSVVQKHGS